jgi:hypothetical protein
MMIVKSLAVGLGIFLVGTIVYLLSRLGVTAGQNKATGVSVLAVYTIWNVWYWLGFVASLALRYWVVRRFSASA